MLTEVSRGLKWQQKCRDPGEVHKPVTDHLPSTGKTKWRVTGVDPCVSQRKQQKGECGTINFPGLKKTCTYFKECMTPVLPHLPLPFPIKPVYLTGYLRLCFHSISVGSWESREFLLQRRFLLKRSSKWEKKKCLHFICFCFLFFFPVSFSILSSW